MKKIGHSILCAAMIVGALAAAPANAELTDSGVLIGKVQQYGLEPPMTGEWPHYKLKVNANGVIWDVAANVYSEAQGQPQIAHREFMIKSTPEYGNLFSLPDGWHQLPTHKHPSAPTGGALDFQRHLGILRDTINVPWTYGTLVADDDGNPATQNSVPTYDEIFKKAKRVFVFGSKYTSGVGVHNVHQNQGNPFGSKYSQNNGIWQDGAMIVEHDPIIWKVPCGPFYTPGCVNGYITYYIPVRWQLQTHFLAQKEFSDANGHGATHTTHNQNGSAAAGQWVQYGPFYATQLQVDITGATGNPDVYIQKGAAPTLSTYRVRADNSGNGNEYLRDFFPSQTPVYIGVYANGAQSSWNVSVKYVP